MEGNARSYGVGASVLCFDSERRPVHWSPVQQHNSEYFFSTFFFLPFSHAKENVLRLALLTSSGPVCLKQKEPRYLTTGTRNCITVPDSLLLFVGCPRQASGNSRGFNFVFRPNDPLCRT